MACKNGEKERADCEEVSKQTIGQCMIDTELQYGDPRATVFTTFIRSNADI